MIIGALPHLAVGRPARVSGMAVRLLCVACVAYIFRPLASNSAVERHWGLAVTLMTALTVLALLLEAVLTALLRVDEQRARFRVALVDEMRVQLPLGAAVGASALLIAFAAEVMGLAALAVFTAPLLVTQVAFRRYAGIRATYLQTVRALAKVTEIGGYVEAGHSERVSRLAVAIGRELGIHEPQLLELEYAALMHDIGQLSLHDPIPGGATVLVSRQDQQRIAELGADVIQQAQVLGSVAEIVRRQNEPYRDTDHAAHGRAGLAEPSRPPLSSRIIKAANAFDDLVGSSLDPGRAQAAVQRLRLDTASEAQRERLAALATEFDQSVREIGQGTQEDLEAHDRDRRRALHEVADRLRHRERELTERVAAEEAEAIQRIQAGFADIERRQLDQLKRVVERTANTFSEAVSQQFDVVIKSAREDAAQRLSRELDRAVAHFAKEAQGVLAERLAHVADAGGQRLERKLSEIGNTLEHERDELVGELQRRIGDAEVALRSQVQALAADAEAERTVLNARLQDLQRRIDDALNEAGTRLSPTFRGS